MKVFCNIPLKEYQIKVNRTAMNPMTPGNTIHSCETEDPSFPIVLISKYLSTLDRF